MGRFWRVGEDCGDLGTPMVWSTIGGTTAAPPAGAGSLPHRDYRATGAPPGNGRAPTESGAGSTSDSTKWRAAAARARPADPTPPAPSLARDRKVGATWGARPGAMPPPRRPTRRHPRTPSEAAADRSVPALPAPGRDSRGENDAGAASPPAATENSGKRTYRPAQRRQFRIGTGAAGDQPVPQPGIRLGQKTLERGPLPLVGLRPAPLQPHRQQQVQFPHSPTAAPAQSGLISRHMEVVTTCVRRAVA